MILALALAALTLDPAASALTGFAPAPAEVVTASPGRENAPAAVPISQNANISQNAKPAPIPAQKHVSAPVAVRQIATQPAPAQPQYSQPTQYSQPAPVMPYPAYQPAPVYYQQPLRYSYAPSACAGGRCPRR